MSFNCMNINNSFLDILAVQGSSGAVPGHGNIFGDEILFRDRFADMLRGGQVKSPGLFSADDKDIKSLSQELQGLSGVDFIKKLKEFFIMLSGNDIKGLTMDRQGLDALEKLLLDAGFEPGRITRLMDDLKFSITCEKGSISLGRIMDKLEGLVSEKDEGKTAGEKDKGEEAMLPASAFAFVESILISIGMPPDERNNILYDVKTDQGIDLKILLKNLKEFEKKSFAAGTFYRSDKGNNSIEKLIAGLDPGSSSKALKDGRLSLQDFISILEAEQKSIFKTSRKSKADPGKVLLDDPEKKGLKFLTENPFQTVKGTGDKKVFNGTVDLAAKSTHRAENSFDLVEKLLKAVTHKEQGREEISEISFNKQGKPGSKEFEKLFSPVLQSGAGIEGQALIKPELEEKLTKLLGEFESGMGQEQRSGSGHSFKKNQHRGNGLKMYDSPHFGTDEARLMNSMKYLSASKRSQARSLPSHVTNQIGRSIVRAFNQGQNEIRLQLKPPELGRMMITIEDLGNGVKVSVVAENQSARDMLVSNSNHLKEALASSGINLERFDVDMGSDFNQSMRDAKNQAGYSRHKNNMKNRNDRVYNSDGAGIEKGALSREKYLTHDGILYYVA